MPDLIQTIRDIKSMDNEELDWFVIPKIMGWRQADQDTEYMWVDASGTRTYATCPPSSWEEPDMFTPSVDWEHAHMLSDELVRSLDQERFINALLEVMERPLATTTVFTAYYGVYAATPRLITEACALVVRMVTGNLS